MHKDSKVSCFLHTLMRETDIGTGGRSVPPQNTLSSNLCTRLHRMLFTETRVKILYILS